jgi:two-component system, chemotaxis family, chemotaxis protein CheY
MFRNFNFLIVDDIPATRRVVKKCLYKLEVEYKDIIEAHSGSQALSLLNTQSFNVIICDLNLQDISGLDVLSEVRSKERHQGVPFIIMTSEKDRAGVELAVAAGVSSYILKPITLENIEEHVGQALTRHGLKFGIAPKKGN